MSEFFASLPLLDNIETSCVSSQNPETLIYNDSSKKISENLYTLLESDFEKYKKLSAEVSDALRYYASDEKLREKGRVMHSCGFSLDFYNDRLVKSEFCRIRLCPMCQRRRALKTYSDFCKILSELSEYSFLHLVLTVPNCFSDELDEVISDMNKCSSKFFSLAPIKKAFLGVVRCLEVSYNSKSKNYHPHFHCLIAVNRSYFKSRDYIKYSDIRFFWSMLWKHRGEYLRSSKWSVEYLSSLPFIDSDRLQVFISKADSSALPEIAKYCVKPLEFKATLKERAQVLDVLYSVLGGKRLIYLSGVFQSVSSRLKSDDDNIPLPEIDKNDILRFCWNYHESHYEIDEE